MTGEHAVEVMKRVDEKQVVVPEKTDRYLSVVERLAADPNVDIEKLQKIIDMKNHEEDRASEQAYNSDMVLAQAEIKVVVKNRDNKQTNSPYADLCALIVSAKPIYTKYGFSISSYPGTGAPEGYVRVMSDIMHRDGCTKTRHWDVPVDMTGIAGKINKTKVHGEASSFQYGRRYIVASTFNIPTGEDDDGNAAGGKPTIEYISGDDLAQIVKIHKNLYNNPDDKKFFEFCGSTGWNDIPMANHHKILDILNQRKVAQATKKTTRQPGEEG